MNFPYLNSRMIDLPATINQLSAIDIVTENLTANNVFANANITVPSITATTITATEYLSADTVTANNTNTTYRVHSVTADRVFLSGDNSKAFHFETTGTTLTAIFPISELEDGFNVSIFNNGTGTILLSSNLNPPINATGVLNETPYTAMFIYKASNQLYGIGVFE